jgi:hypothetical protein
MIPDSMAMAALQNQAIRTEMDAGIEAIRFGANQRLDQSV